MNIDLELARDVRRRLEVIRLDLEDCLRDLEEADMPHSGSYLGDARRELMTEALPSIGSASGWIDNEIMRWA